MVEPPYFYALVQLRRDTEFLRLRKCSAKKKGQSGGDVKRCEFSLYNVHLNCYSFF